VVDPGNHVVEVTAPDRLAKRYDLIIAESENRSLDLAVGDPRPPAPPETTRPKPRETAPPPPEPSPVTPERGPDWQRITGWSALGLGAAGLVTTAIAAAVVLDRKATVKEECKDDQVTGSLVCSPDGKDAADNGKIWGTIGTVAFIVGIAGAGAGSYLLLTADGSDSHAMIHVQARF
jgi:hypothetical protein